MNEFAVIDGKTQVVFYKRKLPRGTWRQDRHGKRVYPPALIFVTERPDDDQHAPPVVVVQKEK